MKYSTIESVLQVAASLKGKRVKDLGDVELNSKNKGNVGNIIEEKGFGIKNNNDAEPDFKQLGIELKVLPLKKGRGRDLLVKERTKICSIDYRKLVGEKWKSSHAKRKLDKILFVFFEHNSSNPINSRILDFHLFCLESSEEPLIRSDWERTRRLVRDGFAHTLSESQNLILAASRAGEGKLPETQWPEQPNQTHAQRARRRAFSLKPSFTKTIWKEITDKKGLDRIVDLKKYSNYREMEGFVLDKLRSWEGESMKSFAKAHLIALGSSKNSDASIVRHALGFTGKNREIKELLQLGIQVKTIPCNKEDLFPFEAMSFPFQPLGELGLEERFDESVFYTYLQGFLFIPLLRTSRSDRKPEHITFGRAIIWRPSHDELVEIQGEWELCREIVRNGVRVKKKITNSGKGFILTNNLPGESDTNYIHLRPHARDSNDLDPSADVRISKQSFWFNKRFIQRLLTTIK